MKRSTPSRRSLAQFFKYQVPLLLVAVLLVALSARRGLSDPLGLASFIGGASSLLSAPIVSLILVRRKLMKESSELSRAG